MFSDFLIPAGVWNGLPELHGGGDHGSGSGLVGLLDALLDTLNQTLESSGSWKPLAGIAALGSNVHPMIVHFPIAFLSAFLLLEVLGLLARSGALRQAASGMLYLGALGAVAAVAAGLIAADTVPHGETVHRLMEWHERLGLTVAFLSVVLALWRALSRARLSIMAEALHLFLAGIIVTCLLFGADLGGLMVYQYGVGVQSLQTDDDHHRHADTHAHDHVHSVTGGAVVHPATP
ncbi:DUF2231 domain-containing protein [Candidatus Methylocalor cossyra]|uniref:DUF2231 domain-containing protein n=1 Tax=Candidatus Methylocalor cossyra TaxID=3108543 RepID=A0ABM9NFX6_9GAMM